MIRLAKSFPAISWFTVERFGSCPIPVLSKFLNELDNLETETVSKYSMPIALAADAMCRIKGAKNSDVKLFNPAYNYQLMVSAREEIPAELADLVLELIAENRLPPWVQDELNMETVMMAASPDKK